MSENVDMKAQSLASVANVAPLNKLTEDDLLEMQARCLQMASQGGEAGEIAGEIARISRELRSLTAEIDDFLAV